MVVKPDDTGYVRVPAAQLQKLVAELLESYDVSPSDARIVADVLVAADLRGVESHGVGRLYPYYIFRLEKGYMKSRADMRVTNGFGAAFTLDADNGLGQVACHRAMEKAMELAGRFGIGVGGVKNSNHFGIAGYYAMMALQAGMIGICICNAQPLVFPTYSKQRLLGTNPFSIAIPAGKSPPFVLDMATSIVPVGRLEVYRRKNLSVPPMWGADGEGRPTTDPGQIIDEGGLFPLGGSAENAGYKGYGLAAAIDMLSGVLTGSAFLSGLPDPRTSPQPAGVGHLVAALHVDAFTDGASFAERAESFMQELKAARRAEGCDRVYVAGEKEFAQWEDNMAKGVPVHTKVWAELANLGNRHGVRLPGTV
jgi:LDH2 family malate/lactate/ureidoglycolate dehydrogenase